MHSKNKDNILSGKECKMNQLKKPVKKYNANYPKADKISYDQFYSCESYHNPCPSCNGTCNTYLGTAKK